MWLPHGYTPVDYRMAGTKRRRKSVALGGQVSPGWIWSLGLIVKRVRCFLVTYVTYTNASIVGNAVLN